MAAPADEATGTAYDAVWQPGICPPAEIGCCGQKLRQAAGGLVWLLHAISVTAGSGNNRQGMDTSEQVRCRHSKSHQSADYDIPPPPPRIT